MVAISPVLSATTGADSGVSAIAASGNPKARTSTVERKSVFMAPYRGSLRGYCNQTRERTQTRGLRGHG